MLLLVTNGARLLRKLLLRGGRPWPDPMQGRLQGPVGCSQGPPVRGRPPVGAAAHTPPAASGQPARGCLPAARSQGQHLLTANPQSSDSDVGSQRGQEG
ncbi:hypothetical protein B296_00019287 [Ensete ventricosum]|uniref:Uncharacterized protein n=1 Tax=Ensete ventricosum TaxID=4639 RepID=A0A426ZN01_ENSVE|nr:hypothetical protein B296_00019287 [Ensete ventricosum]